MAWIRMIPKNTGGGRKRSLLTARLDEAGQFSMSHAVADLLGNPTRVIVDVDPEAKMIKLTPTTPENSGGYALSGGGNASYRIRAKEIVTKWDFMVGSYSPKKQAASLLFVQTAE